MSYLRGPYNTAFFSRHNRSFRVGAALHFSHSKQHDVLELGRLAEHDRTDASFDGESLAFIKALKARTEPAQETYAPFTAQAYWRVLRAIDWTHMHHEQTYDIMSDADIPWPEKKRWTDRAVEYYLEASRDVAFSPAPLDVTMRRAAVMMKPYFTVFRTNYPRSNNFFYAAHWWHPAIYEAQVLAGNDVEQEQLVRATDDVFYQQVLSDRPQRMLLLREMAPRYSRLTPESANIFDNLHMFHGIVYDILAYEGWSRDQKRAELYRVIDALRARPGDAGMARKFPVPHPDVDPRVYEPWMKTPDGEMTRIMMEMHEDMMPMMMPTMPPDMHAKMMNQLRMKLTPGVQPGEEPGSLHDAMMKLTPNMQMMPGSMEPGQSPQRMVDMMLEGWKRRHGSMADAAPLPMDVEPSAPRLQK